MASGGPPEDYLDPERHLKRLEQVFGVSERIQQLAVSQRVIEKTPSNLLVEEKLLSDAKQRRNDRISSLEAIPQHVLAVVADQLGIGVNQLIDGLADGDAYVGLVQSLVQKNGRKVVMFIHGLFDHPAKGDFRSFRLCERF